MEQYIKEIFANIISLEGGIKSLANVKNDRGGLTRAGLTARTIKSFYKMDELPTEEQMANLSELAIYDAYHTIFWKHPQFDKLFNKRMRKPAMLLVGSAINHGQGTAIFLLQMVCNEITQEYNDHGYETKRPYLKVDGIIGPKTIGMARSCMRWPKFSRIFLQHRQQYYNAIVVNDIDRFLEQYPDYADELTQHKFLTGWTNRLIKLEEML